MNYDDYKTEEEPIDENDNNCGFCGEPCEHEYCNKKCWENDINGI